jgi:hypothetical protein
LSYKDPNSPFVKDSRRFWDRGLMTNTPLMK